MSPNHFSAREGTTIKALENERPLLKGLASKLDSLPHLENFQCVEPKKLVVVIPTLNEENGIGLVLDNLKVALHSYYCDVLVVDGYSIDKTVEIAKDRRANIIFQPSKGYGDAFRAGFNYACEKMNADIIVMTDADGTYDAFDVPIILGPILSKVSDILLETDSGN